MMHRIEAPCPLPMLGQEARRLPPAARSVLSDTIDNFRRRLVETLTELGRPSPSPLADSVVAELIGAMTLARAMADEESALRLPEASRLDLTGRELGRETCRERVVPFVSICV